MDAINKEKSRRELETKNKLNEEELQEYWEILQDEDNQEIEIDEEVSETEEIAGIAMDIEENQESDEERMDFLNEDVADNEDETEYNSKSGKPFTILRIRAYIIRA